MKYISGEKVEIGDMVQVVQKGRDNFIGQLSNINNPCGVVKVWKEMGDYWIIKIENCVLVEKGKPIEWWMDDKKCV